MSLDEELGLEVFGMFQGEDGYTPSREPWKDIPPWGKRKIISEPFWGIC